jgi:tagatose 1,6-diphosphate aldolase
MMLLPSAILSRVPWLRSRRFTFFDPGKLRDEELELIVPARHWVDAVLASSQHIQTRKIAPEMSHLTRKQLLDFLALCPGGHQEASSTNVPGYHFWMRDHSQPDLPMAGSISLRIGNTEDVEFYYGHVGYHVYPPHRGKHFAERAVRLLTSLIELHDVNPVWITCNPDNWASLRTCQRLGATLVQTVAVPHGHPLRERGEVAKCRFRWDASADAVSCNAQHSTLNIEH